MVTTTWEEGMRGESRAYDSVVAFVRTHLPAICGESTGAAWCSDTGAEKVSEIVAFGATFCSPGAGLLVFR